jgi:hypothetical protein
MKTIENLLSLAAMLVIVQPALAAVPSTINYQGRLTDGLGVIQTGTKSMSLKIYDAATAGTQLYAETIGNVTVDANGVYGFQFGAAGTSDTLITETIATTDGTTLTFQKTLSNTPVLPGTVSVTDGTYSWNESTGNPGSAATATVTVYFGFVVEALVTNGGSGYTSPPAVTITGNGTGAAATATVSNGAVSGITITNAGSGYATGATISIAPPPAPFIVNYSGGVVTATYASAPTAGQIITATYRYSASGISGALSAGPEQWLELTVDGIAHTPRQKVLAVPFAKIAESALTAMDQQARQAISDLGRSIANNSFSASYSSIVARINSTQSDLGKIASAGAVATGVTASDLGGGKFVLRADSRFAGPQPQYSPTYFGGYTKFYYKDGTDWTDSWSQIPTDRLKTTANPNPGKLVTRVESSQNYTQGSFNPTYNAAEISVYSSEISSLTYSCSLSSSKFMVVPQTNDSRLNEKSINLIASDGSRYSGNWDQWISIPDNLSVTGIEVKGRLFGESAPTISVIKILNP